jgi:DNA-directed RNA polymerase specialized sigma24 family protein
MESETEAESEAESALAPGAPAGPGLERAGEDVSKAELDRAFEELYRAHLRDVYSYAYYRVGNHHDAEDLTEQAFLQAYRHFDRARRESSGRP